MAVNLSQISFSTVVASNRPKKERDNSMQTINGTLSTVSNGDLITDHFSEQPKPVQMSWSKIVQEKQPVVQATEHSVTSSSRSEILVVLKHVFL